MSFSQFVPGGLVALACVVVSFLGHPDPGMPGAGRADATTLESLAVRRCAPDVDGARPFRVRGRLGRPAHLQLWILGRSRTPELQGLSAADSLGEVESGEFELGPFEGDRPGAHQRTHLILVASPERVAAPEIRSILQPILANPDTERIPALVRTCRALEARGHSARWLPIFDQG